MDLRVRCSSVMLAEGASLPAAAPQPHRVGRAVPPVKLSSIRAVAAAGLFLVAGCEDTAPFNPPSGGPGVFAKEPPDPGSFMGEPVSAGAFRGYVSGPNAGRFKGSVRLDAAGTLMMTGQTETLGAVGISLRPLESFSQALWVRPGEPAQFQAAAAAVPRGGTQVNAGALRAGWLEMPRANEPVGHAHLEFLSPSGEWTVWDLVFARPVVLP